MLDIYYSLMYLNTYPHFIFIVFLMAYQILDMLLVKQK